MPSFTAFAALWEPYWVSYDAVGGDVTGDGYGDVVVRNAGGTISLYLGGPTGLGGRGPELYVNGGTPADVVIGDINHDGRGDVVAGAPEAAKGGAIRVFYGTATGLVKGPSFGQATAGVPGADETGDGFGGALAAGDVNGDGYADVAIGAKTEDINGVTDTGSVTLLKGSAQGLTATGAQAWNQNSSGVPGGNERYDEFGAAVTLVDHNRDGRADLSINADQENNTGAVTLLKGTILGITTSGAKWIDPAAIGAPTAGLWFGSVLIK